MKKLCLVVLASVLMFNLNAQIEEFKEYEGIGKLKEVGLLNENGQRTGEWRTYTTEDDIIRKIGSIFQVINYLNGERNGNYQQYSQRGLLEHEGNFLNGYETGEWKSYYYDNGILETISNYLEGKPIGEWKTYYENGELREIKNYLKDEVVYKQYHWTGDLIESGIYLNENKKVTGVYDEKGNKTGEWTTYTRNDYGNWDLASTIEYLNGKPFSGEKKDDEGYNVTTTVYLDGIKTEETISGDGQKFFTEYFLDGKKTKRKEYHNNGQVSNIENYSKDGYTKTGECKFYYSSGQLKKIGNYLNDIENGEWSTYDKNGDLNGTVQYLNGQPINGKSNLYNDDGKIVDSYEYLDGKLIENCSFTNGKLNNRVVYSDEGEIHYYGNGQLKEKEINLNGKFTGENKSYYENGQLMEVQNFINGELTGENKSYYENGQLMRIDIILNGTQNVESKWYHRNGELMKEENYINGYRNGEWKSYRENGKLQYIGRYLNNGTNDESNLTSVQMAFLNMGLKAGEWKSYYENGQLARFEKYMDWGEINWEKFENNDQLTSYKIMDIGVNNGIKIGKWEAYYENGQLKKIENYLEGYLNGEWKIYYNNGQYQQVGNFLDGRPNGEWKAYDENGKLIKTENFD